MTDTGGIGAIIATYEKHGWKLRRVLLSEQSGKLMRESVRKLVGDVPILNSVSDAAWFSRPPSSGAVAWEIRYLGDIPFALLEHVDESKPEFEATLAAVEARLWEVIAGKNESV